MVYYTYFKKDGAYHCHCGRDKDRVKKGESMSRITPDEDVFQSWVDLCIACGHKFIEPVLITDSQPKR